MSLSHTIDGVVKHDGSFIQSPNFELGMPPARYIAKHDTPLIQGGEMPHHILSLFKPARNLFPVCETEGRSLVPILCRVSIKVTPL